MKFKSEHIIGIILFIGFIYLGINVPAFSPFEAKESLLDEKWVRVDVVGAENNNNIFTFPYEKRKSKDIPIKFEMASDSLLTCIVLKSDISNIDLMYNNGLIEEDTDVIGRFSSIQWQSIDSKKYLLHVDKIQDYGTIYCKIEKTYFDIVLKKPTFGEWWSNIW